MKTFLKRLGLFLIMLPVLWFVFVCCWGMFVREKYRKNLIYSFSGHGFLNTRLKQADTIGNVDVLIIGSSHAYRGFDTRIFKQHGYTAFNLGSSSQTPIQSHYLLKKYLKKLNPDLVIIEVGFMTLSSDGLESAIDMVSNVDEFDNDLLMMTAAINDLSLYNTLAYSFLRKRILMNERYRQEKLVQKEDIYVEGGFVEHRFLKYDANPIFFQKACNTESKSAKGF